ncbi:hypothetical protein C8R48DRAFT_811267 [Suillus tomentosus]|nr:hypothetical protein C8R48DRAFT_811267 [Suillus tomentosus]
MCLGGAVYNTLRIISSEELELELEQCSKFKQEFPDLIAANIQQARCLQTLKLKFCGTFCDASGIPLELPGLKTLYLSEGSLPQCTHFLRQVTTRQLSHINISYCGSSSPAEVTAFVESLSTSCQTFAHLERIYVVDTSEHPDYLLVIPLHSESFQPLFKFKRLLSVKFIGIGNFELDDRFLNDVPVAWPNIWELKLTSWKRHAFYSVTFTAMMSLASRCRSLQTLHLTVDATQSTTIPQALDEIEELWPTQTTLRNLHLGYSRVLEVALVDELQEIFGHEWGKRGVYDAEERLQHCINAVAIKFRIGTQGQLYDPIYHDPKQANNIDMNTIYNSPGLVVISVTMFWGVALKLVCYKKEDPTDIVAMLHHSTKLNGVQWTPHIMETWIKTLSWPMGYNTYKPQHAQELQNRIHEAVHHLQKGVIPHGADPISRAVASVKVALYFNPFIL